LRRCGTASESGDDQALSNKLAYCCNADEAFMIRAFFSSPHFAQKGEAHKRKCQRDDYLPKHGAEGRRHRLLNGDCGL
jgi:hypothetical protein